MREGRDCVLGLALRNESMGYACGGYGCKVYETHSEGRVHRNFIEISQNLS